MLVTGMLDVYAPSEPGPWPVVVMFHGAPSTASERVSLADHARRIADLGFVVFNADWGRAYGGAADPPLYDGILAGQAQGACAVEFARARAYEYGGDPATIILFGHSGGANNAAQVVFARPAPSVGCLADTQLGDIDALVTWEGDWLLSITHPVLMDRDAMLAVDPRLMDALTPWPYLARHTDQKVMMLVSEDPSASLVSEFPGVIVERPVDDPWAADSWLDARDPSGDLRRQLEADGAFADGILEFTEVQELLYTTLQAQGNPITLDFMPDSSHAYVAGAGWPVFLAAFSKAATEE
jgi:acetyl esterase/lipase